MVSASECQAKKETSGKSEETEEISSEREETESTQQLRLITALILMLKFQLLSKI